MRWRVISPDLTRAHPGVPPVLGPFESDDPQHGMHRGVVYAIAPSYRRRGTIWAGTDDGLVWITRDGGAHWRNVTPPGMTPWSKVAQIDASRVDDDTAFVAVNRFRLDDLRPYVYVTRDGGAHWQLSVTGLPNEPVNAVRQDPQEPQPAVRGNRERRRTSPSTPARTGRACSSVCRTRRCATSSCTGTTRSSRRTDAASGFSTTSRRCARWRARARHCSRAAATSSRRAPAYRVRRSIEHRHAVASRRAAGRESARRRDPRLRARRQRPPRLDHDCRRERPRRAPLRKRRSGAGADSRSRQTRILGAAVPAAGDRRRHAPIRLGSARAAAAVGRAGPADLRRCRTIRRAFRRARSSCRDVTTVALDADGLVAATIVDGRHGSARRDVGSAVAAAIYAGARTDVAHGPQLPRCGRNRKAPVTKRDAELFESINESAAQSARYDRRRRRSTDVAGARPPWAR